MPTTPRSPRRGTAATSPPSARYEPVLGRLPILDLSPLVDGGAWPAKAFRGEVVPFACTAFREGHDPIGVDLVLTSPDGETARHRMRSLGPGTDRWGVSARLDEQGAWSFRVQAWADDVAAWWHAACIKVPAGIDVEVMLTLGAQLLTRAAGEHANSADGVLLSTAATALTGASGTAVDRLRALADGGVIDLLAESPLRSLVTSSASREILVERERAGVGAWYEFFPRSAGAERRRDGAWTSGTFRTAEARLPEIAAMGFDVVYLPPIHPIGRAYRKGPNNSLDADEHDPGSPWAIGSTEGGHDAIHPDLGTEADFKHFIAAARKVGLEVAIDLALQASPDHPWVREHPEWFTTLPDGSIAYAENPPKKYQDIYPINFDNDPKGIRAEALRIVRRWMRLGIRIFRVDNPHTKPLDFWEWLIHTVNAKQPDVVFLAEAFTRPAIMQTLAKAGFQQSYTYFTWRNTKEELEEFLDQISHVTADFLRPNLFVNTPDILTEYLQFGGRGAFKIRAAIAATAAPSWGVYSGFELYEAVARSGAEEYVDNEKYEYRPRDYAAAEAAGDSLAPYLRMLNQTRRTHPSLGQLRNLHLHSSEDDAVLVYSKHLPAELSPTGENDTVLVVVNVDPHSVRETLVHLDLTALGVAPDTDIRVTDAITGASWTWSSVNYVRLDAFHEPAHILSVKAA
ncbi:alpha-1,4-glucan--maltose-1-phosphate maltosyltransferase [Humibacter albus]|uniref:alpha-1,4-glucan--maltose-1-phosphate maltosyltransferase n=1 Tax=Humibacter albus TaxID=427754 RepID=UPI0003B52C8F|nr:alpha-1,4-glucan--maltose-1-phosphate maltosyltransferase [Humibacter albus]